MGLVMPQGYQPELRRLMKADLVHASGPDFATETTTNFLSWIDQTYGRIYADNIYVWGVQVFEKGQINYSLEFWRNMARGRSQGTHTDTPPFILNLRELLSTYPDEDVYRIKPTSDWDKRIYKHQEYDNLMSAMELVQATIDRYTFRKAWITVRERFPSFYDVSALETWGIQTATLMQIPVDRLGEPGSWPDLPTLL